MGIRSTTAALCFASALALASGACGSHTMVNAPLTAFEAAERACEGVSDFEREHPRALRASQIEAVRPFVGERRYVKFSPPELRGADIFIRAWPGATRPWVARVVSCHMAYLASVEPSRRGWDEDPLLVGLPEVTVIETEAGFRLRIEGHASTDGEEILRRAERMAVGPSSGARSDR